MTDVTDDERAAREWLKKAIVHDGGRLISPSIEADKHRATILALLDAAEAGMRSAGRFTVEEVKTLTDDAERHARDAALEEAAAAVAAMKVTGNDKAGVMAFILVRDACVERIRALEAK